MIFKKIYKYPYILSDKELSYSNNTCSISENAISITYNLSCPKVGRIFSLKIINIFKFLIFIYGDNSHDVTILQLKKSHYLFLHF